MYQLQKELYLYQLQKQLYLYQHRNDILLSKIDLTYLAKLVRSKMSASETVKLHFKPKFQPTSVNRADWPFYFLYQQFYPLPSVQCGCQSCSEHPWLCRGLHIAISSGLPSFKQLAWRRNMIWDQNLHRTIVMQSCTKFAWGNQALQKLKICHQKPGRLSETDLTSSDFVFQALFRCRFFTHQYTETH